MIFFIPTTKIIIIFQKEARIVCGVLVPSQTKADVKAHRSHELHCSLHTNNILNFLYSAATEEYHVHESFFPGFSVLASKDFFSLFCFEL